MNPGVTLYVFLFLVGGKLVRDAEGATCKRDEFDCKRWAAQGKCKTMKSWMEANCCRACKDVESYDSLKECPFSESTCAWWSQQGYCSKGPFKSFMQENCCKTCQDKKPTTDVPLPTEGPVPTEKPKCVDDRIHCKVWAGRGWCEGQYKVFMHKHCCKTCTDIQRRSTALPLPTDPPPTCIDDNKFCEDMGTMGWCFKGHYKDFMRRHCCLTCKALAGTPTPPIPTTHGPPIPPTCIDDNKYCKDWGNMGWCDGKYKDYMKQHCCKTCKDLAGKPTPPRPTPPKPTGGPTLSPKCLDDNKFCESWAKTGECERNKDFMKKHCCKSCSTKFPCVDDRKECKSWAASGECTKNKDFMREHCCKTCKGKHPKPSCTDDNENCQSWAKSNECEKNPDFMSKHCRKSCKLC